MALTAKTVRLACDETSSNPTLDVVTGLRPIFWRGATALIQCALFNGPPSNGTYVTDLSDVVSVELMVRKHNAQGPVLIDQVLDASQIQNSSYAEWIAGTGQQFTFSLAEAFTSWDVLDSGSLPIYFVVNVITATTFSTMAFGYGQIVDVGIVDVVAPTLPTGLVSLTPAVSGSYPVTVFRGLANISLIASEGVGAYVYALVLPLVDGNGTPTLNGALVNLYIELPASSNPTINVYNGSVPITLIHSAVGDSDNPLFERVVFVFDGNQWLKFGPPVQ